jgi:hypothetical protein
MTDKIMQIDDMGDLALEKIKTNEEQTLFDNSGSLDFCATDPKKVVKSYRESFFKLSAKMDSGFEERRKENTRLKFEGILIGNIFDKVNTLAEVNDLNIIYTYFINNSENAVLLDISFDKLASSKNILLELKAEAIARINKHVAKNIISSTETYIQEVDETIKFERLFQNSIQFKLKQELDRLEAERLKLLEEKANLN